MGNNRIGRTHFMVPNGLQQVHRAACGREGYPESGASEASTANGDRFEITSDPRRVTCQRCAVSALVTCHPSIIGGHGFGLNDG